MFLFYFLLLSLAEYDRHRIIGFHFEALVRASVHL